MSDNHKLAGFVADMVSAPLGDIIESVGRGVGEAQAALDAGSLAKTLEIYANSSDQELQILREIGYQPTFYSLPETTGEINIAMTVTGSNAGQSAAVTPAHAVANNTSTNSGNTVTLPSAVAKKIAEHIGDSYNRSKIYAAPVNAAMQNRYNFNQETAAKITFKIVPVPPPGDVSDIRATPNVAGKNLSNAVDILAQFDLEHRLIDTDGNTIEPANTQFTVTAQQPEAGSIIRREDIITLTLKAD